MESKEITRWQDQTALERFQMIAPLIGEGLDPAKRAELRRQAAQRNGISERTLRRYEAAYQKAQFEGLKPVSRIADKIRGPFPGFDKVLEEAIQLKREVPSRSVSQIIFILEAEGIAKPGQLTRPTLQRYLYKAGFGKKQMKKYAEAKDSSSKRFCKPHRMMLVQGDIKYVMKLPLGKNGRIEVDHVGESTLLHLAADPESHLVAVTCVERPGIAALRAESGVGILREHLLIAADVAGAEDDAFLCVDTQIT